MQDEVLRINTDIVQTDLMVLDKQGRAVTGLTREQFELLVDGQPQPILFFESVESGSGREATKLAAARGKTAPETAAAAATPTGTLATGRSFIFFIDDLHLGQASIQRTREMLNKFVDKMSPGDQAMLFTPTNQIGFLQQLTDNKAVLKLAASRINYQSQFAPPTGRRVMTVAEAAAIERGQRDVLDYKIKEAIDDMGLERSPAITPTTTDSGSSTTRVQTSNGSTLINLGNGQMGEIKGDGSSAGLESGGSTNLGQRRQQASAFVKGEAQRVLAQANSVGMMLLSSLETVARGSASLPGRKLLFFISDGFVIDTRNSATGERLQRVIDASARSGVAVYTLDSQGLTADFGDASKDVFSDIAGRTGSQNSSTSATSLALDESRELKAVLRALAEDTGGRAILNRNDLASGLQQVIDESSSYYVLAWKPLEVEAGKPRFKTIQVSVKGRSDLRVLSRKGFYTAPPPPLPSDEKAASSATKAKATEASEAEVRAAIISPFPKRQINVASYAVLTNEASGGYKIAALTDLSGYTVAQGKGELDFAVVVLDDKGKSVSGVGQKVSAPSDEDGAKPFRVTAKLPNALQPGLYQVRVAARDSRTGRIGSVFQWVEVPEFKPGKMSLSSLMMAEAVGGDEKNATLEVARKFARTSSMILQFFVYNPTLSADGKPDVTVGLNVLRDGKMVIGARPAPLPALADPARLEYSSGFPLASIPPGRYALQVVVEDRVAKTTVTQQLDFVVE
ncbi:MAG TPA: VWA domain-containing protein [Pyrinomonadaceae bacterium]|nr:VWA domain-containing protein [Pyrinomonadaceae bacterium]